MGVTNRSPEFLSKFPMGKVPTLETADGFCLAEGQAICRFVAESGSKSAQLLGTDTKTRAKIDEWACFAEQELTANTIPPLMMAVLKMYPYDEKRYDQCMGNMERAIKRVQIALEMGNGKFLVGEQLTLADIMVAGPLHLAGKYIMDEEMMKAAPALKGWLEGLWEVPEVKEAFGGLEFCETRVKN